MPEEHDQGRVSIVMPAYQLGESIADNVEQVIKALASLDDVEVIVSDDGSTDTTYPEAEEVAAANERVTVVRSDVNQGKGAAFRRGFFASTGNLIVLLDGDLDLPPDQLPDLIASFPQRNVDVLVGEKLATTSTGSYPVPRRVLSSVFSFVARILFRLPVAETQTGLKLFTRGSLQDTLPNLRITRYSFDLELLVRIDRAGFSIGAVPVQLGDKGPGSGLQLATLWEMGRDTLRIWWWSVRS